MSRKNKELGSSPPENGKQIAIACSSDNACRQKKPPVSARLPPIVTIVSQNKKIQPSCTKIVLFKKERGVRILRPARTGSFLFCIRPHARQQPSLLRQKTKAPTRECPSRLAARCAASHCCGARIEPPSPSLGCSPATAATHSRRGARFKSRLR